MRNTAAVNRASMIPTWCCATRVASQPARSSPDWKAPPDQLQHSQIYRHALSPLRHIPPDASGASSDSEHATPDVHDLAESSLPVRPQCCVLFDVLRFPEETPMNTTSPMRL